MDKLSAYWKTVVAVVGTALMIWNTYSPGFTEILPASWSHNITLIVGVLMATGIFGVPNQTTDPNVAAGQSVRLKTGRHALPE